MTSVRFGNGFANMMLFRMKKKAKEQQILRQKVMGKTVSTFETLENNDPEKTMRVPNGENEPPSSPILLPEHNKKRPMPVLLALGGDKIEPKPKQVRGSYLLDAYSKKPSVF